ncbi:oxidoreductase of aldo/keto reductase family, subgroup 1 [Lachnospiraceae bacterium TWA4]|nr:oxidoreductase of aldo/keto reductase family, subgroup 1 [Lachnospiraceae bacterium TWA4]
MKSSFITLNNGNKMPMQGFGTLQIKDAKVCEKCIYESIKAGVRMFDTAPAYFNEEAVGKGIAKAITEGLVMREELFIVTKLWIQDTPKDMVRAAVMESMRKLQVGYLDLYLIHQPYGSYLESWPVMEQLVREGTIKNIGVCNFSKSKLEELQQVATINPTVNQIEIHPYYLHKELREYMAEQNIAPMAWGPLSEGQRGIFENQDFRVIAEKHDKSVAQVILRWHLQRGVPAIPKSIHTEYIRENFDILDFELAEDEMNLIESYDMGYSEIIDHNNPLTEKWLTEWKIHE